jgi:acyl-CoA synthetase (AMP-forming)/AMP-acid ligase II
MAKWCGSEASIWPPTVARAATMLQRHGVEPGTVVGIHLDNSAGLEALVLHWATQWLGAAAVPLGTRLTEREVAYIAADADAVLLCSGLGGLNLARAAAGPTTKVLDCSPGLARLTAGCPTTGPARVTEDVLADVLYTSGTTGRPKGSS